MQSRGEQARESPIPVRVRELQQRAKEGLHRRLLRAQVELKEAQSHLSDQLTQRRDQVSHQYNKHVTHIKHQWQVSPPLALLQRRSLRGEAPFWRAGAARCYRRRRRTGAGKPTTLIRCCWWWREATHGR